ncbi:MAG: hypothetical protein KF851_10880 [Pirellulaceae bacterium]|nr:hypothetical protein [Pirellulaceae bacterium]
MNTKTRQFPIRVLKVGGSLLTLPDLPQRLIDWLWRQTNSINVLIVGGGAIVKTLRAEQHELGLSDNEAHFRAIDLMWENGVQLKSQLLSEVNCKANEFAELSTIVRESKQEAPKIGPWIFDPRHWSRANFSLPRDWNTSSDSIAAAVAVELNADEFVLGKSEMPPSSDWSGNALAGFIDNEFPNWVSQLPACRIVNFRCPNFREYSAQFSQRELC